MIAMAVTGTHRGRTNSIMNSAPPVIITVAIHFARARTTPPLCASRGSAGPCAGAFSSQCDSRGELRAAAQAASRTKGHGRHDRHEGADDAQHQAHGRQAP